MARRSHKLRSELSTADFLSRSKRSRVTCLFAQDCEVMHEHVGAWAAASEPEKTLVTLSWERVPSLADELEEAVAGLGRAALTLYPMLYASAHERAADRVTPASAERSSDHIVAEIPGAALHAAKQILESCRAGSVPRFPQLDRAERVRQLALALDPQELVIELLVRTADIPQQGGLFAFGKGAEWIARNSRARVIVVLADSFAHSSELDALYGPRPDSRVESVPARERTPPRRSEKTPANDNQRALYAIEPQTEMVPDTLARSAQAIREGEREPIIATALGVDVSAVKGKPHPASDAEQLLHARLVDDRELGPLFQYNQTIATTLGPKHRVDLVWFEGKLVIEIDGHRDHSRIGKFVHDRMRDYQLMLTGYRVMRLSDQHVIIDPELTVERIRAAVHYLREAGERWASKRTRNKR